MNRRGLERGSAGKPAWIDHGRSGMASINIRV